MKKRLLATTILASLLLITAPASAGTADALASIAVNTAKNYKLDDQTLSFSAMEAIASELTDKVAELVFTEIIKDLPRGTLTIFKAQILQKIKAIEIPKRGVGIGASIFADAIVNATIEYAADVVRDNLVDNGTFGSIAAGEYARLGILQLKVAYAAKTGGLPGAVIAQSIIATKQISDAVELFKDVQGTKDKNESQDAQNSAAAYLAEARSDYLKASPNTKFIAEANIRSKLAVLLTYENGNKIVQGANIYIDAMIAKLKDADSQKYRVFSALLDELSATPENADALRSKAAQFAEANFYDSGQPNSENELQSNIFKLNAKFKAVVRESINRIGYLYDKAQKTGGLSKLSVDERAELMALAIGIDSTLRIYGESEILGRISVNLSSWENAYNVKRPIYSVPVIPVDPPVDDADNDVLPPIDSETAVDAGDTDPDPIEEEPAEPPVETVTPNFIGRLSLVGTAPGKYPTYSSETMNASTTGPKPNGDVTFNTSNNAISGLVFGTPDTQGGLGRKFDHFVWGDWSGGSKYYTRDFDGIKFSNIGGYFVYGDAMPRGGLTGTAFYKGTLAGDIINQDQTISRGAVEGEIGIIANLDSGKLGGWLKTETPESDAYLVSDIDDAQIIKREKQVVFEGQLSGKDGQTGAIGGTFYGAKGEEIAGSFYIDHDYDYAGIFGASLTTEYPTRPTDYIPKVAQWAGQMSLAGGADANNLVYARSGINASGVAPTGPANSFLLFNDDEDNLSGNVKLNVFTDSPDNHDFEYLIAGEWSGGSKTYRRTSDSRTDSSATSFSNVGGYAVYGQLMPEHARTGTANYTGVLIGDFVGAENDPIVGRGGVVGEIGITASFASGALGGWMAFGESDKSGRLVADIENAAIYRENGVTGFRGQLGGNEYITGGVGGQFYGPNGSELGGSYWLSIPDAGVGSSGVFAAWETGTMPEKPEDTSDIGSNIIVTLTSQPTFGSVYSTRYNTNVNPAYVGTGVKLTVPDEHGGGFVTATQKYSIGSYSYVNWGKWEATELTPAAYSGGGYWISGERTWDRIVHAKTGNAVFNGEMVGDYVTGSSRQNATGLVELNADFDSDRISARMQWAHNSSATEVVTLSADIDGSRFYGNKSDSTSNSRIEGQFLGPDANEVGGETSMFLYGQGTYNGVFRAKQGGSITFQTPSTGGVSSTPGVSGGGDEGGGSTATGGVADLGQSGGRDISVSQPNTATGF